VAEKPAAAPATTKSVRSVWGQHLNRRSKSDAAAANSNSSDLSSRLAAKLVAASSCSEKKTTAASFANVTSTRTSLKKGGRSGLTAKSRSFFGSLGDDSSFLADLSQSSFLLDESQTAEAVEKVNGGGGGGPAKAESEVMCDNNSILGDGGEEEDESVSMPAFSSAVSEPKAVAVGRCGAERLTAAVDAGWLQRCAQIELDDPAAAAAMPVKSASIMPLSSYSLGASAATAEANEELGKSRGETTQRSSCRSQKVVATSEEVRPELTTSFKGLFSTENVPPSTCDKLQSGENPLC
jgi:hypothetical protein